MYRANMKEFYVKAWTGVLPVCLFLIIHCVLGLKQISVTKQIMSDKSYQ